MHVLAEDLVGRVPDHLGPGPVQEGAAAVEVDPVDPLGRRVHQGVALAPFALGRLGVGGEVLGEGAEFDLGDDRPGQVAEVC